MQCKILKAFPLYRDGFTREEIAADSVVDIPDDLVEGLKSEGFLEPATASRKNAKRGDGPDAGSGTSETNTEDQK